MFGKTCLALLAFTILGCTKPEYLNRDINQLPSFEKTETASTLSNSNLKVSIRFLKVQTEEETGTFVLKFWRPNAADQSPVLQDVQGEVKVRLWMPSMGHGSSPVVVSKADVGTYKVDEVFFSMPGDWDIEVTVVNANQEVIDETKIPLHY